MISGAIPENSGAIAVTIGTLIYCNHFFYAVLSGRAGHSYTDEADMIFTTAYRHLRDPEPFSPPGSCRSSTSGSGRKMIDTTLTIK